MIVYRLFSPHPPLNVYVRSLMNDKRLEMLIGESTRTAEHHRTATSLPLSTPTTRHNSWHPSTQAPSQRESLLGDALPRHASEGACCRSPYLCLAQVLTCSRPRHSVKPLLREALWEGVLLRATLVVRQGLIHLVLGANRTLHLR